MNDQLNQIDPAQTSTIHNTPGNIYDQMIRIQASSPYWPMGGLQFVFILMGLFNSSSFVKFNSVQALIYWPIAFILSFVLLLSDRSLPSLLVMSGIIALLFVIPVIFTGFALKGRVLCLPLIGRALKNHYHL